MSEERYLLLATEDSVIFLSQTVRLSSSINGPEVH